MAHDDPDRTYGSAPDLSEQDESERRPTPERVYRNADPQDASRLAAMFVREWGDIRVIAHGVISDLTTLPTLVAEADGEIIGSLTYRIEDDAMEIVSISAADRHSGIGTGLLDAAAALAGDSQRIWLTTTNDNLDALRFYQRRGFHLVGLRPEAVAHARQLKPDIPPVGEYGIELRDELDLELPLR
jgi:ribosomal protein S18 acetylase RimI-like enzyme